MIAVLDKFRKGLTRIWEKNITVAMSFLILTFYLMNEEFKICKEKKRILRYYKRLLLSSRKLNSIKFAGC